jgi:hypothetical protein
LVMAKTVLYMLSGTGLMPAAALLRLKGIFLSPPLLQSYMSRIARYSSVAVLLHRVAEM